MIDIKTLAVIGGGASGLFAAINAAYAAKGRARIVVLERMTRVGRKILATGNGRCNYTNINATWEHYYGKDRSFVKAVLSEFNARWVMDFFGRLGVLAKEENAGKVFPYSDRAESVLDALRLEAERVGVEIKTGFDVKTIVKRNGIFKAVSYKGDVFTANSVIIACGGKASPDLGSNGSGYGLLKSFGHTITDLSPALVQIRLKGEFLKALSGIKIKGNLMLFVKDNIVKEEYGEILFTDYGVSGPPVFQISGFAGRYKKCSLSIDFMPEYDLNSVFELLSIRRKALSHLTMENFFVGMLHKRLGNIIARRCGIEKLSFKVSDLSKEQIWNMAYCIKLFKAEIEGLNGWKNAQVTAGGAEVKEFDDVSMESLKVKGLYCCGEILDVLGECGGFNLQWAWASGAAAGRSAGEALTAE